MAWGITSILKRFEFTNSDNSFNQSGNLFNCSGLIVFKTFNKSCFFALTVSRILSKNSCCFGFNFCRISDRISFFCSSSLFCSSAFGLNIFWKNPCFCWLNCGISATVSIFLCVLFFSFVFFYFCFFFLI